MIHRTPFEDVKWFSTNIVDDLTTEQKRLIDDAATYLKSNDMIMEFERSNFCVQLEESGVKNGMVEFRERYHAELGLSRARLLRDRLNVLLDAFPRAVLKEITDDL